MENILGSVFLKILNMSVTAGYCILAVFLIRFLFRKAPRKYLYALWLVVAFRLICPVSLSTSVSLFNADGFLDSAPTETFGEMEYIAADADGSDVVKINAGNEAVNMFVNQQLPHAVHSLTGYSMKTLMYAMFPYLSYVWTFGVTVFLIYYVVSAWRLRQRVRWAVRAEEADAPLWSRPGSRGQLGPRPAEVCECDQLASPFAMGVLHPRIYLPCHLEGMKRRMILLHEQFHIHRKDHLVKLLAFFLLAVYWFHPLVWAAWFAMCKDMEMSCDEKVLEYLGEGHGKEYSMTLLAFAAESRPGSRMPLGFGEHDVKRRIRHALDFKKPAFWVGALSVAVVFVVLIVFGTNGKKDESSETEAQEALGYSTEASLLYESRNPYVGDVPADGEVIRAIRECLPAFSDISAYKTELQTSEEPYQFHFVLEEAGDDTLRLSEEQEEALMESMVPAATLMLALIDNLGEVKWSYCIGQGSFETPVFVIWDVESAQNQYGIENLKEYGSSPEKVQELLDILKANPIHTKAIEKSTESSENEQEFWNWYSTLPSELYDNAMPHGSEYWSYQELETKMTILAQTPDKIVTVYGCSSEEYGNRGVTIDYRITPDGDSNHTYMDFGWNSTQPGYEVAMADYDGDGRDEIALAYLQLMGEELYRQELVVFETFETAHLEPYYFDYDARQAELEDRLGVTYDRENKLVHILDNRTPESSVPLMSISHLEETEYEYEGEAVGVELQNILLFSVGEDIRMSIEPAVILKNRDTPLLARYGMPQSDDEILQFQVNYEEVGISDAHFTLGEITSVSLYR